MNEKPITREFLTYLASYVTDRIVTAMFQIDANRSDVSHTCSLCSHEELRKEARIILDGADACNTAHNS